MIQPHRLKGVNVAAPFLQKCHLPRAVRWFLNTSFATLSDGFALPLGRPNSAAGSCTLSKATHSIGTGLPQLIRGRH
jgi:hypothetical protein